MWEPRWGWEAGLKAFAAGAALVVALALWAWLFAFVTAAPLAQIYNARVTVQQEATDSLEAEVGGLHDEIKGLWAEIRAYRDSNDRLRAQLTWSMRACPTSSDK